MNIKHFSRQNKIILVDRRLDMSGRVIEVDDDGTLASWGFHALDTSFWNKLLRTLKHPGNDPPESPPKTSFPQTNSSPPASPREPTPPATPPYHTPPRSQSPLTPHNICVSVSGMTIGNEYVDLKYQQEDYTDPFLNGIINITQRVQSSSI